MRKHNPTILAIVMLSFVWIVALFSYRAGNEQKPKETEEQTEIIETFEEAHLEVEQILYERYAAKHRDKTEVETESEVESTYDETETEVVEETETEAETEVETTTEYILEFHPYDFLPICNELQYEIWKISYKYEFDFDFLLAWGLQESGLNPDCVGDNGKAIGMYQIQPQWHQGLADSHGLDIYNHIDNCEIACILLNSYLARTNGNYTQALSIYRWGNDSNMPEADGRTYEEHIQSRLNWINEQKGH